MRLTISANASRTLPMEVFPIASPDVENLKYLENQLPTNNLPLFCSKKTLISSPKISLATKNSAHVFSNFGKDCVGSDSMARANHVFLTRRPTKVCFESSKAFSALILLYLSQRHLFKSCCREKKPFLFSTNRLQINAAPYAGH